MLLGSLFFASRLFFYLLVLDRTTNFRGGQDGEFSKKNSSRLFFYPCLGALFLSLSFSLSLSLSLFFSLFLSPLSSPSLLFFSFPPPPPLSLLSPPFSLLSFFKKKKKKY